MDSAPNASARHGLYELSSQYKHWRFSSQMLETMRKDLMEKAVQTTRAAFENDEPGSSANVDFLTAFDELQLVRLYASKIPKLCSHFHFNEEIEATGITYLKRFYLRNTAMDWHPRNVMLTAVFLAAKTCNRPYSIGEYVKNMPKTEPADVLDLEFPVAQSLNFEFAIWHAHRALWGLLLDLQSLDLPSEEILTAHSNALEYVRRSRLTDAEFIFTPSQIALASLQMASPTLASRWLSAKASLNPSNSLDGVSALIEEITEMIRTDGEIPDETMVKDIDRRLKLCKNPEKVPGSRAFLKKQALAEAAAQAKRARKAELARKAMEAEEDPFGSSENKHNGTNGDSNGLAMDVDDDD